VNTCGVGLGLSKWPAKNISMVEYVAHKHKKWYSMRLANDTQHGETGGLQTHNTVQEKACKQNTIWPLIKLLY